MSNSSHFDRKYQLVEITKPDDSVIKGISNAQGETELSQSAVMAGMKVILLPTHGGAALSFLLHPCCSLPLAAARRKPQPKVLRP